MPIGKSKISDMDFGSFENTLGKNIEADKASDKFDKQLQAFKDAETALNTAKSSLDTTTASLTAAKDNLDKATDKADAVTKAIDSFIAKVRDIKFTAKVDDADKLTDDRKKYISEESKFLEDHRKENKEILSRHFYDMSNMMSRNEGVWLSNGWVKAFLWVFLPCFLYTVISVVYFVASNMEK